MKHYTIISLFIFTLLISGCSTQKEPELPQKQTVQVDQENLDTELLNEFEDELKVEEEADPFSGYNRVMTDFNDGLYRYFLSPVSKGYKEVTNDGIREAVSNFFDNLLFPVRFVNNILQGKITNAGEELGRFVINTTFGVIGFFDPAGNEFELEAHPEDFGQTLGVWGVGSGPHIVLPFFGPSNLRDTVSLYPDSLLNPIDYHDQRGYNLLNKNYESILVKTYGKINDTAIQDQYEIIKKDAIDLYPYLKNSYEQYRLQQIKE